MGVKLLHSFNTMKLKKCLRKLLMKNRIVQWLIGVLPWLTFIPFGALQHPMNLKKAAKQLKLHGSFLTNQKGKKRILMLFLQTIPIWEKSDHRTRCLQFEQSMKELHDAYPGDNEATIFYALAMNAAADPSDKTYAKQKIAGSMLNALHAKFPNHPGIVHYIIHTYDTPELAEIALPAARKYASVAPSSATLHMPSHIFTRLGLWDECVD